MQAEVVHRSCAGSALRRGGRPEPFHPRNWAPEINAPGPRGSCVCDNMRRSGLIAPGGIGVGLARGHGHSQRARSQRMDDRR